jgi:hypothetical protein
MPSQSEFTLKSNPYGACLTFKGEIKIIKWKNDYECTHVIYGNIEEV